MDPQTTRRRVTEDMNLKAYVLQICIWVNPFKSRINLNTQESGLIVKGCGDSS
jgi:hypothetical protein